MVWDYIKQLWHSTWKRKANIFCLSIAVAIYFLNQTLFKNYFTGIVGYFCHCYLNDLVCPLFFLSYAQIMLIWAGHEIRTYTKLLLLGMVAGLVWEYFAPIINPKAVTDVCDLFCYFVGIQLYYLATIAERKLNS